MTTSRTTTSTTAIDGCLVVALPRASDARGAFARAYDAAVLAESGVPFTPVQANLADTAAAGTVRGLHYQVAPHGEQKFLRCVRGAVYDVVVDLRPESATYRRWIGVELSAENGLSILVPRGCAHGYMSLTADVQVLYFVDAGYEPSAERVLAAAHVGIGVDWPLPIAAQSEKDASAAVVGEPPASGY